MPDAKTINVPGIGKTNRGVVIGGVLVFVVFTGYAVYKYEKNKSSSTTTPNAPPAGATSGYGYGEYGYGAGYYGYGFGYSIPVTSMGAGGTWEYGYGAYGYGYYNSETGEYEGVGTQVAPTLAAPQTNAEWAQAATTELVNQGYTSTSVTAALGAYLAGASLTTAQVPVVQAALALAGDPPVAGPAGFPPAYNTQGTTSTQSTSTGGTGTASSATASSSSSTTSSLPAGDQEITSPPTATKSGTVTVPSGLDGMLVNNAVAKINAAGLAAHGHGPARSKTNEYVVTSVTPGSGAKVKAGSTVDFSWSQKS